MNKPTYLDYAASAPTKYWGWDYNTGTNYNPNQPYAIGEQKQLKEAESITLDALGSKTGHVIFGANATVMAHYVLDITDWMTEACVINPYEHDCFARVLRYRNINPVMFVVDDFDTLNDQLRYYEEKIKESAEHAQPVCFWMWVNNLTGQINPVETIGKIAHAYGMEFVCDLTAGLHNEPIPKNIDDWCDIAIWSGAKLGAEKGTGGIWFSDRAWKAHSIGDEPPLHFGTPNVAQAMAQANAMGFCQNEVKRRVGDRCGWTGRYIEGKWNELWIRLIRGIRSVCHDYDDATHAFRWGSLDFTLGITGLYLPDINADAFQQFAWTRNVYFSVFHSACAGQGDYRVAKAYGLTKEEAEHCIRLSFGYETNEEDIDRFVDILKEFREMFCNDN